EYLYPDFVSPTYYEYCGCPFIIRFYDDNGKVPPYSLPVGDALAEYEVFPDEWEQYHAGKKVYYYGAELGPELPFYQEEDKTYWISIVLNCGGNILGPPLDHPQWFWQFSEDQWHDYPAQKSEFWYKNTNWHPLYQKKDITDDMAFALWYEEPTKP
ncbi:MAG: hypothetical protein JSW52_02465, partial [Candidatus Coatesbacteria bacterium]